MLKKSKWSLALAMAAAVALSLNSGCESDETATGAPGPGGPGSGGSGGSGATGGTAAVCDAGDTRSCYEGPMGTQDVGQCLAGTETCADDGSAWGMCTDQVVPATEDCTVLGDEDCDGVGCSDPVWGMVFGDTGLDLVTDVAIDSGGNIIIVGQFYLLVDLGGGVLNASQPDFTDVFVAKFDSAGNHLWSKSFGDGAFQYGPVVAVDGSDNVVLSGRFEGSINFGGSALQAAGTSDLYLAKLDPSGNHVWSQVLTNHTGQVQPVGSKFPRTIAIDSNDDIIVGGDYTGHFGCQVPLNCTQVQGNAAFMRKYDSSGASVWGRAFDATGTQGLGAIAISPNGNLVAAGEFQNTINFGNSYSLAETPNTDREGWIAEFGSDGLPTAVFQMGAGGASIQQPYAASWQSATDYVVVGKFTGGINLSTPVTSNGSTDTFIAAFSNSTLVWEQTYGGPGGDTLYDVKTDADGQLVVSGYFDDQVDFGLGLMDPTNFRSALVAKLTPAGETTWAKALVGSQSAQAVGVATAPDGRIALGGVFNISIDVGNGDESAVDGSDAFVMSLEP